MKRFWLQTALGVLVVLFSTQAVAASVSVQANIDYAKMTLEDEAQIQVRVQGGGSTAPVVPNVPGLDIVPSGKSSQFSFVNGHTSSSTIYLYTVVADEPGQYKISPFIVYVDGKEYQSNPLELQVTPLASRPFSNQNLPPQNQQNGAPDPNDAPTHQAMSQQSAGLSSPFWITTNVTKINPYVGETLLYHFKFFSRVSVQPDRLQLPDFHDFYAEVVVPERGGREEISGVTYATSEIVYALTPLKAGALTIDKAVLPVVYRDPGQGTGFDPFFGGKAVRKNLTAESIALDVRPLPEPRPKDFSGLVGQYQVRFEWQFGTLKVGDSATLSVDIAGVGNITGVKLPDWSVANAKLYQNKPLVDTHIEDDHVQGSANFQVALVPTQAGEIAVPDLTLSTFDPVSETYVQHVIKGIVLAVAEDGAAPSDPATFAQAPAQATPPVVNIRGFYEDVKAAETFSNRAWSKALFVFVVLLFPVLVAWIPIVRFLQAWRKKLGGSKRVTQAALSKLRSALKEPVLDSRQLFQITQQVLSGLLGESVRSRTPKEITETLQSRHPKHNWQDFFKVLEAFEAHSYGRGTLTLSEGAKREFLNILEAVCGAR